MEDVNALKMQISADLGGALVASMGYIGDHLGLFKLLSTSPISSAELASKAQLNERYVREWLHSVVAAGYVEYNPNDKTFFFSEAQQKVFGDEGGTDDLLPYFQLITESIFAIPKVEQKGFKEGTGVPYSELGAAAESINRMHVPVFKTYLAEWVAKTDDVITERLQKDGGVILDVGCGVGTSSRALAKHYPKCKVIGVDPDHESIVKGSADIAGGEYETRVMLIENTIEGYAAKNPDLGADIIVAYDCVHDMVSPVSSLAAMRDLLGEDGVLFWSEPRGSANPLENRNPQGRMRAALSPLHCMTVSLAHGGAGLGTMIGQDKAKELAESAGFSAFALLDHSTSTQFFYALRR